MIGWIKLHRKLLQWEWYSDKNVRILFIHCLLMANYEDSTWRGVEIKKGSFISSIAKLANGSGLTIREVRTALTKLNSTREVTSNGQADYTLFTVVSYDVYQSNDKPLDKLPTSKRQASDKLATSTKETKEDKEDKEELLSFDSFWNLYPVKVGKVKCEPKWNKLKVEEQKTIMETLPAFIKNKPFESYNHPNPETYLNQKRWEDVISGPKETEKKEYTLFSPMGRWTGFLTEAELAAKTQTGYFKLTA